MSFVAEATELVFIRNQKHEPREYTVDLWRELKKRWMVGGVLVAVLAAVLAPRLGAPGGPLVAQYSRWLPLSYIYFAAGARAGAGGGGARGAGARARLACVSCAHACLVSPAVAAALLAAAEPGSLHRALLHGVVVTSVGGGCSWLSLAVCEDEAAALIAALAYVASLLTTPAAMLILCGRAALPPLSGVAGALAGAVPAFVAGAARGRAPGPPAAARGCALALLYLQCCEALPTHGQLHPADLLAMLLLEMTWLMTSAGACWAYAWCGLLTAADARVVAACALPRAADLGWQYAACVPAAVSRLPGAFLPAAQALLLAALPPAEPRPAPPLPH